MCWMVSSIILWTVSQVQPAHVPAVLHRLRLYVLAKTIKFAQVCLSNLSLYRANLQAVQWWLLVHSQGQWERVGIQSARMNMSIFTKPRKCLTEIWPTVIAFRSSLASCLLVPRMGAVFSLKSKRPLTSPTDTRNFSFSDALLCSLFKSSEIH